MRHFAIIGRPVTHSIAGQWFTKFFRESSIDADFRMIVPSDAEMKDFHNYVLNNQFDGLLVTIPFKMEVMPFLDEMDEHAKAIGAVNLIDVREGKLMGFNTDYAGFDSELRRLRPAGCKKAIIMGIGGAAAAVIYALQRQRIEYIKVSRRKELGDVLYSELSEQDLAETDLIVNTTPLGMGAYADDCPPVKYHSLNNNALAFDLIYNPTETIFMKRCADVGCQTSNGRGMVEFVYKKALGLWGLE